MNLDKKIAVVTGAASGIGRETAIQLAGSGVTVACLDRDTSQGQETVHFIRKQRGDAGFFQCDVTSYAEQKKIVDQVIAQYGRLDIAINNAGIGGGFDNLVDYDHTTYNQVIAVNQTAVFFGMQLQLRQMLLQKSGAIVNVASMAGLRAQPKTCAYVASKHAVIGLTKTAALENAKYGIRVNAVCPVYTLTPMVTTMFEYKSSLEEKLKNTIPLRRYGTPADIAQAILWLCSDASSFSTGLILPIDGGLSA